jgi:hypothetical protein
LFVVEDLSFFEVSQVTHEVLQRLGRGQGELNLLGLRDVCLSTSILTHVLCKAPVALVRHSERLLEGFIRLTLWRK